MYEHRTHDLLPLHRFSVRLGWHALAAIALLAFSLAIGIAGYMGFEQMSLLDAFLNAAMLLGGMGPVDVLHTNAGKFFAGCYALYAGVVFLVAVGVVFAPVFHRILHKFHLDQK